MIISENLSINSKLILQYLTLFAVTLIIGSYFKNYIFIIPMYFVFYYIISNNTDNAILFIIFWLYTFNYFIGQCWITNVLVSKYLIKGDFYILLLMVINIRRFRIYSKYDKILLKWIVFTIAIVILSDTLHSQTSISAINYPVAIYLYFIIVNLPNRKSFNNKLLNLIIAIGILQLLVSILQVTDVIPRPVIEIGLGTTNQFVWEAGLSDAASGTIGAGASNITSWIGTVLFLFLYAISIVKRNLCLSIFSFIFLLQYGTIDSKTALGVTAVSLLILLFKMKKYNKIKSKYTAIILVTGGFLILMSSIVRNYYSDYTTGITDNRENVVINVNNIINNYEDWGKILGFVYLSQDYSKENPINFLIGYGRGNFTPLGNRGYIESMDTKLMQSSNITRSRSSFIKMFAELGIPGLIMMISLYVILMKGITKRRYYTDVGKSFSMSGQVILIGSAVFMFLYGGHVIRDLAYTMLIIIYALVIRIENEYAIQRL